MNARQLEQEAARWLMRRDEPDWSRTDQMALEEWLAQSMAHKAAFWRLEHGWNAAARLAAMSNDRGHPEHRIRWRQPVLLAIAASVLLTIGVTILNLDSSPIASSAQQFATEIGEREIATLSDGSRVELNTGTQLRSSLTAATREIWLADGEAYFDVVHDASRPFIVHAGPRTITVLGTKFSVRVSDTRVQVAVSEGRVRIDQPDGADRSTTITRGDLAVAEGSSLLVAENSVDRVERTLSWRRGMLTFAQSSLADAAAEFNRYNRQKIRITDPGAAHMRIGGTFQADNVQAFARLLRDAYGLEVEFAPDEIRISS